MSGNWREALQRTRNRTGKFFREDPVLSRHKPIGCVALIRNPQSGTALPRPMPVVQ